MTRAYSLADLPQTLPVFPLPGALLLPRARLPLNIFEPRYLAMVDDVLRSENRLIGMIQPAEGPKDIGQPRLHDIGCAGRIISYAETEDGRYLVTLAGISRFRIASKIDAFSPYLQANVEWNSFEKDLASSDIDKHFDRPTFLALLEKYFKVAELSTDWDSLKEADEELLINSLSALCPFSAEEKQALLESPSLQTRRETLATLMQFALSNAGLDGGKIQ